MPGRKGVYECHDNDCKDDRINPVKKSISFFSFLILLFPEKPFHLLGDVLVKNRNKAEEPPKISEPYHPQDVEDCPKAEPRPFIVV